MRRRAILGLAATAVLGACAHPAPEPAAPAMAWHLSRTPSEGAKLAFGHAQSDHLVIMLTCQPRSGEVLISMSAPRGAAGRLEFASRGDRLQLQGEVSPGMSDGVFVEAAAPAADPALRGFARTGELVVHEGGRRADLTARGDQRQAVEGFFAACRATA